MMNRRQLLAASVPLTATTLGLAGTSGAAAHVPQRAQHGAGFRLSIAAYSYRQYLQGSRKSMTLFEFMRKCADLGAEGTELTEYYFEKPITAEYVRRLKRECHLLGLTVTGTPIGNSFTLPAGPERDAQIKKYMEWLDISADLGSPAVRTFAGSAPKGISEADARRNVIECLNQVCEHAEKRGVFVALENHGGVVAEADGLLEIVKAVPSPWLGVNLDTGNFRTVDPYGDLARCAPYAVTVQFKVDMFPKGQPKEDADLPRIVKILRAAGYRGFITLEYEASEDPTTAVPRHVAAMKQALSV